MQYEYIKHTGFIQMRFYTISQAQSYGYKVQARRANNGRTWYVVTKAGLEGIVATADTITYALIAASNHVMRLARAEAQGAVA